MKRRITVIGILAGCTTAAFAQAPQPAATLQRTASGSLRMSWHGITGRSYFIQQSDDLKSWHYLPLVQLGAGTQLQHELHDPGLAGFLRLRHSDQRTADPATADFDGDTLPNLAEISSHRTDPFRFDSDADNLSDGWEVTQQLNPLDDGRSDPANGSAGDPDRDGLTNAEELIYLTQARNADTDGDGITDGGEIGQGTDPRNPEQKPRAEWFILTGDLPLGARKERSRTVSIPPGQSRVITIVLSSDEYPSYTGSSSFFNDILEWYVEAPGAPIITDAIDINSRHTLWQQQSANGVREVKGFSPAYIENGMTLTAPDDAPLQVRINLAATNIGDSMLPSTVLVGILPLVATELQPLLADSAGAPIAESARPRNLPGETNGMTEDNPLQSRVAHREIGMRIVDGAFLKGRRITWTMDPRFVLPGTDQARFRGRWPASGPHSDRFEKPTSFAVAEYERIDARQAATTLDNEGGSAIRANLPPVAFNQGRVRVTLEDCLGPPAKLADLEVPAVVVIDAGHGGDDPGHVAGGVMEKNLTLEHALAIQTTLRARLAARQPFHRVLLTRAADDAMPWDARAAFAAANGADVMVSLHFNAGDPEQRGVETLWTGQGNVNATADEALATRLQAAAALATSHARLPGLDVIHPPDPPLPGDWLLLDDAALGNTADHATLRACIQRIEFLTHPQALGELTDPAGAALRRTHHAANLAEAIIADLETQPSAAD